MQKKIERFITQYTGAASVVISVAVIILFNIIATPLINSGDDTFLMYTLGGGYGENPSNLLQYNHIWHPLLGWIVKSLFVVFPGTNWYSFFLLLFHIAGCTAILYVLFKKLEYRNALLLFLIFFLFIEARLLLSFTFTGAAFVVAAGSSSLLVYQLKQNRLLSANTFFAILLLIMAGMLRLQIVWLVVFLFSSVAITVLSVKQIVHWVACMGIAVILLFGLNKYHQYYYKRNIAGWEQQEKFRQGLFYAYNRQTKESPVFKDSVEEQLFSAGFLYDSVKFSAERVAVISKQITRTRNFTYKEDRTGLYWFFIEMRIYLLLFGVLIFLLLLQKQKKPVIRWLLSLLAFIAIHLYLFIFLKITIAIHLGLLLFLFVSLCLQLERDPKIIPFSSKRAITPLIALALLFGWMGMRLKKENADNKRKYQLFLCMMKDLNQDKDKLFVATDDAFLIHYFYIWNTPAQFPAENLLYKDRLITHTYLQTLARFKITNLDSALLYNKNVFLVGAALPALKKQQENISLPGIDTGYRCMRVWQLHRQE